jgi:putative mRNA 3-end processing factor
MQLLSERIAAPFLVGKKTFRTLGVYQKYLGLSGEFHSLGTHSARGILKSGSKYIAFLQHNERKEDLGLQGSRIVLSAFAVPRQDPVLMRSDKAVRIALTDHADFAGTIGLIKEVKPKLVIADDTRGGSAQALVEYIKTDLGIDAIADVKPLSKSWGG